MDELAHISRGGRGNGPIFQSGHFRSQLSSLSFSLLSFTARLSEAAFAAEDEMVIHTRKAHAGKRTLGEWGWWVGGNRKLSSFFSLEVHLFQLCATYFECLSRSLQASPRNSQDESSYVKVTKLSGFFFSWLTVGLRTKSLLHQKFYFFSITSDFFSGVISRLAEKKRKTCTQKVWLSLVLFYSTITFFYFTAA